MYLTSCHKGFQIWSEKHARGLGKTFQTLKQHLPANNLLEDFSFEAGGYNTIMEHKMNSKQLFERSKWFHLAEFITGKNI